jgi:putative Holliday junction resolvase
MSRILAIDYGMRRVGLAQSDRLRISLNPLPTIPTENFDQYLLSKLSENEISTVVFGLPCHADGTITQVGMEVKKKITWLTDAYPAIAFKLIDEYYSSREAVATMVSMNLNKKKRKEKGNIDQMSAILILKKYLESL